MHICNHHCLVHGLAHIVNRQQGNLHACQRLHLHACLARSFYQTLRLYGVAAVFRQQLKIYRALRQLQQMAQRNQLAGALGRHNSGNTSYAQHITLGHTAGSNLFIYFSAYADFSLRHGNPCGVSLIADIHHQSIARSVKMCKFTHCLLLQSLYLSANLAHIKARCFYIKAVSRRLGVNNLLHGLN